GQDGPAILLGTDSFWEGVDLPGEALEILIITRLPFPVPSDPVFSALADSMSEGGKDPFYDLSIPRAILKLRQGVGRLIRTTADHGIVIITDERILSKNYGRLFIESLPVGAQRAGSLEDLIVLTRDWFNAREVLAEHDQLSDVAN
ncbi:MAG TPA: helicase, partial [Candidatus Acetothermia bacterium]|nr:helicase [Candidatus Acetothermia bacterium]HEX32603.1 helicase [Candidatus Acetothermia bacterium]